MPTAVLADGTRLNFPDGTPSDAIQRAVKAHIAQKTPGPRVAEAGMGGGDLGDIVGSSSASRFAEGAWKNLNPVNLVKGLAQATLHPLDTIQGAGQAMGQEWEKAGTLANEGRYVEAAGHGLAGSIPFLGPAAAAAGERVATGDIAGGLGEGVGLAIPTLAPRAISKGVKAIGNLPVAGSLAAKLEAGAAGKVADVMSPKVGAGKVRFGNKAQNVAPALVKDMAADGAPLTRGGFHEVVKTKLAEATNALDEAADARLPDKTFSTADLLTELEKKRSALVSTSAEGKSVVPGPNSARVAVIDQAIEEIRGLGPKYGGGPNTPSVGYEPMRIMRQAYDGQAKVIYNPSMTADFLKQKGAALGASDVAGVLRDKLAKIDPATAKANAKYSLYKAADDVLSATAEVERTRPRVGRQIMARLTGGLLGAQAGAGGAALGFLGGPIIDSALASGLTSQLKMAALMQRLAGAIRSGNVGEVASLNQQLKQLAGTATTATGARSTQTEPARP